MSFPARHRFANHRNILGSMACGGYCGGGCSDLINLCREDTLSVGDERGPGLSKGTVGMFSPKVQSVASVGS